MKKKSVSPISKKKAAKQVSPARGGKSISIRTKVSKAVLVKKKTKTALKSKKSPKKVSAKAKTPVKVKTPYSSRISRALSAVPALNPAAKRRPPKLKSAVEPLSLALPQVETAADLPFSYNKTEIVLLARDPYWAFTYWDFSAETWKWMAALCEHDGGAKTKLRAHDLDRGLFHDQEVSLDVKSWHLNLGIPNASFEVEIGIVDSKGKFHRIALSNRIKTPRSGPSETVDPEWNLSEFEKQHLYGTSVRRQGISNLSSSGFSPSKRPK